MTDASLDGASVLLLGATGGLGRALAEELTARGAALTLVGASMVAGRLHQCDRGAERNGHGAHAPVHG